MCRPSVGCGLLVPLALLAVYASADDSTASAVDPDAAILKVLDRRHDWELDAEPLNSVVKTLRQRTSLDVSADVKALKARGIEADAPVSFTAKNLRLESVLNHIVRQHRLAWTVFDGGITITTPAVEEALLLRRTYAVQDLITYRPRFTGPERDPDALIEVVRVNAVPEAYDWAEISVFGNTMVVRSTWRNHQRVKGLLAALRQGRKLAMQNQQSVKQSIVSLRIGPEHRVVEQLMGKHAELDFNELPLANLVRMLRDEFGLPVLLDLQNLQRVGIKSDVPLSFRAQGLSLGAALDGILRPLELTWMIKDEMVIITTPEFTEEELDVRVYPVLDLISVDTDEATLDSHYHDYDSLVALITFSVTPDSWSDGTGPGPIDGFAGMLIIPQTPVVHREIEDLLAALREVRRRNAVDSLDPSPVPADGGHNRSARDALIRPFSLDIDERPLQEVCEFISKQVEVPVLLDATQLASVGVGGNAKVSGRLNNVPFEQALSRILSPLELVAIVHREAILVTTPIVAEEHLELVVYPIKDLIEADRLPEPRWKFLTPRPLQNPAEELVELITSTIDPESWGDRGGAGAIDVFEPSTALVISQTHDVQRKVENLLAQLRKTEAQQANSKSSVKSKAVAENPLYVYRLTLDRNGKTRVRAKRLAKLLQKVIAPQSWNNDGVEIHTLRTALVIRQREKVHREISRLLNELEVLQPAFDYGYWNDEGGGGFNAGGFGSGVHPEDDQ